MFLAFLVVLTETRTSKTCLLEHELLDSFLPA